MKLRSVTFARAIVACLALGLGSACAGGEVESPAPYVDGDGGEPTFLGMKSSAILAAALHYPAAKVAAEEPPLSLTSSDGTGLALSSLESRAVVEGPLAFTELHLRFDNPENRTLEGRFAITLPPGATVSRLAMKMPDGWQEAEVVEKAQARRAYEDALHRKQDPALMEKEAGNEFRARIFPIPARASKEIIVSYSQELHAGERYKLPLRGLPEVGHLDVSALVGGSMRRFNSDAKKPGRDFEVEVPAGAAGLRSDDVVLARVKPSFGEGRAEVKDLVVLFDTSASRALGFAGDVQRLGRLVEELAKTADPGARLTVAAFDQTVDPVYDGALAAFGPKNLEALLARRPLGASDLASAMAWLGKARRGARAIVVTDSVATAGGADAVAAEAKKLRGTIDRIDAVLVGGIRDDELAKRFTRGVVEKDGVVVDGALAPNEIARKITLTTRSGITVAVAGAEWSWPAKIDGAQPGDEVLVYALMNRGAAADGKVRVTLGGALTQTVDVALANAEKPLLERAAATAEIARLTSLREQADAAKREELQKRIVRISTRFRVLSDFTSLLVLESERDYDRFGIDRRALADIMTVGERGVAVMHRTAPVLAVREEPPPPPPQPIAANKTPAPPAGAKPSRRPASAPMEEKPAAKMAPAKPQPTMPDHDGIADSKDKKEGFAAPGAIGGDRGGVAGGGAAPPPPPPPPPPPAPEPEGRRRVVVTSREDRPAASAAPSPAAAAPPAQAMRPGPVRMMEPPRPVPAAPPADDESAFERRAERPDKPAGPPAYTGKMADVMDMIGARKIEDAVITAVRWQADEPGDIMAAIALGESLEAAGNLTLAARAYGTILDLFPARADMRRFAAERLERLGANARRLAADAFEKAAADRPDHLNGHRLYAFSLLRAGRVEAAFVAIEKGLAQSYPSGRFAGGVRVLREDLGLIGAAWIREDPKRREEIEARLAKVDAELPRRPSLRFVLYWETDANDVDFHIHDGKGGHAFYSHPELPSGGELYADVTTGYGPECFTIEGAPTAYPYNLQIHYYSRGPMGYGMGKLEIIEHDGKGGLKFEERPYVVMNDRAFVDLGDVTGPLGERKVAR